MNFQAVRRYLLFQTFKISVILYASKCTHFSNIPEKLGESVPLFCADPLPKQTWHLGGPGHSVLLSSECSHEKFSVLKEEPSTREDCYVSTLRIEGAEKTDSREYVLHLENYLGLETHCSSEHWWNDSTRNFDWWLYCWRSYYNHHNIDCLSLLCEPQVLQVWKAIETRYREVRLDHSLFNHFKAHFHFSFEFAWSKCLTFDLLLITFWVAWSNFVVADDTCQFLPSVCQPLTVILFASF